MFDFWGDGLSVKNLTMGNYCNVDLEFPLKKELGRKKRMSAITQAHVPIVMEIKLWQKMSVSSAA